MTASRPSGDSFLTPPARARKAAHASSGVIAPPALALTSAALWGQGARRPASPSPSSAPPRRADAAGSAPRARASSRRRSSGSRRADRPRAGAGCPHQLRRGNAPAPEPCAQLGRELRELTLGVEQRLQLGRGDPRHPLCRQQGERPLRAVGRHRREGAAPPGSFVSQARRPGCRMTGAIASTKAAATPGLP